eukprot:11258352-Ditylum_brightwellii.AAC.1
MMIWCKETNSHAKSKEDGPDKPELLRDARDARKQDAYNKLEALTYSGSRYCWGLDPHIESVQKQYTELSDCEEPVAETKKVKDFMDGIIDLRLDTAKKVVLGDNEKLNIFEECQQYFANAAGATTSSSMILPEGLDYKSFIPNDKCYALEPVVHNRFTQLREANPKWKPSGKGEGKSKGRERGKEKGGIGDQVHRFLPQNPG